MQSECGGTAAREMESAPLPPPGAMLPLEMEDAPAGAVRVGSTAATLKACSEIMSRYRRAT